MCEVRLVSVPRFDERCIGQALPQDHRVAVISALVSILGVQQLDDDIRRTFAGIRLGVVRLSLRATCRTPHGLGRRVCRHPIRGRGELRPPRLLDELIGDAVRNLHRGRTMGEENAVDLVEIHQIDDIHRIVDYADD